MVFDKEKGEWCVNQGKQEEEGSGSRIRRSMGQGAGGIGIMEQETRVLSDLSNILKASLTSSSPSMLCVFNAIRFRNSG